jgi:hypothetical protein
LFITIVAELFADQYDGLPQLPKPHPTSLSQVYRRLGSSRPALHGTSHGELHSSTFSAPHPPRFNVEPVNHLVGFGVSVLNTATTSYSS